MSVLFNFHAFLTVVLLGICAKMHFPAILEQRTGLTILCLVFELGERLSPLVAVGCFTMGVSIIFF
ncbi:hypothetical protein I3843_06G095000 [Carya illinoinensis]|nr:hypothetical protein I3843_06G095000 [Carya illinoinensis]